MNIASTGSGSTDGMATQILSRLNIAIFAEAYGFDYLHIPFDEYIRGNNAHKFGEFSTALQNLAFNFPPYEDINPISLDYANCIRLCASHAPRNGALYDALDTQFVPDDIKGNLNIRNYLFQFKNEYLEKLVILDGFWNLFSDTPYVYQKFIKKNALLNPKFLKNANPPLNDKNEGINCLEGLKIAVHIRRGDVSRSKNEDRFIDIDYFNNVMKQVIGVLNSKSIKHDVWLHSEEEIVGAEFPFNPVYDPNPIKSFIDIYNSDIVIGSRSSHSSVPPLISGSLGIFPEDSWLPCLPSWIKAKKGTGEFDIDILINYLKLTYGL